MNSTVEKYDVAVIGGGPAGMIAAGKAAEVDLRQLRRHRIFQQLSS